MPISPEFSQEEQELLAVLALGQRGKPGADFLPRLPTPRCRASSTLLTIISPGELFQGTWKSWSN
ncbi:MAG: hypothetical protein IPG64_21115 [Haliea sp.]|nr:hypothetical protein [Haliea sp.]